MHNFGTLGNTFAWAIQLDFSADFSFGSVITKVTKFDGVNDVL